VLLDNGQGTGETFDWSLVQEVCRPFLLAGGLTPQNVTAAIEAVHPWGVDMSSGVETHGTKDPAKMRAAVEAARRAAKKSAFFGGETTRGAQ
jgi:phosphoribosylanthranilate isomerase